MNTENKVTVTQELSEYAKLFFQRAFEENDKTYEGLDEWDSFSPDIDLNAYFYDKYIGVSAYAVTEDGETDTDTLTSVFRFHVGENPDDPLNQIPLGDDEYIDISNAQAHLTPENVLLMSRAIDPYELEDEYSLEHIVWLVGQLEDALEEALKKGETK
jgi:hypothetical protein